MAEPPDFEEIEPPDFEEIAARLAQTVGAIYETSPIVEQLRLIWNARGAADAEAVEHQLASLTGWVTSEPYRQQLRDAITALNR